MLQFRHIVVGYNFSPDGEHALQAATNLAEREGAALALVHVVDPVPFTHRSRCSPPSSGSLLAQAASRMRAELIAVAERRLPRTLPVTIDVSTGKPFVTGSVRGRRRSATAMSSARIRLAAQRAAQLQSESRSGVMSPGCFPISANLVGLASQQ